MMGHASTRRRCRDSDTPTPGPKPSPKPSPNPNPSPLPRPCAQWVVDHTVTRKCRSMLGMTMRLARVSRTCWAGGSANSSVIEHCRPQAVAHEQRGCAGCAGVRLAKRGRTAHH